jgi:hypothetical protein
MPRILIGPCGQEHYAEFVPLFRVGIVLLAKHTEAGQSQPETIDDTARIEFCFKGCFLSKAHGRAERRQTQRHDGMDVSRPGSFVFLNRIVVYQPATTVLWIGPDCPLSSRCLQRSAGPETLELEAQKLVWRRVYLSIAPDGELGNPRPSKSVQMLPHQCGGVLASPCSSHADITN